MTKTGNDVLELIEARAATAAALRERDDLREDVARLQAEVDAARAGELANGRRVLELLEQSETQQMIIADYKGAVRVLNRRIERLAAEALGDANRLGVVHGMLCMGLVKAARPILDWLMNTDPAPDDETISAMWAIVELAGLKNEAEGEDDERRT